MQCPPDAVAVGLGRGVLVYETKASSSSLYDPVEKKLDKLAAAM
jgi:hypothetical protein